MRIGSFRFKNMHPASNNIRGAYCSMDRCFCFGVQYSELLLGATIACAGTAPKVNLSVSRPHTTFIMLSAERRAPGQNLSGATNRRPDEFTLQHNRHTTWILLLETVSHQE
jgi:hypothetical protein